MYRVRLREIIGFASLVFVAAIPLAGCMSPTQLAALNCVVANDGATVVAVVRPGLALPATGLATVGCQAGTQVGQIIGAGK